MDYDVRYAKLCFDLDSKKRINAEGIFYSNTNPKYKSFGQSNVTMEALLQIYASPDLIKKGTTSFKAEIEFRNQDGSTSIEGIF